MHTSCTSLFEATRQRPIFMEKGRRSATVNRVEWVRGNRKINNLSVFEIHRRLQSQLIQEFILIIYTVLLATHTTHTLRGHKTSVLVHLVWSPIQHPAYDVKAAKQTTIKTCKFLILRQPALGLSGWNPFIAVFLIRSWALNININRARWW